MTNTRFIIFAIILLIVCNFCSFSQEDSLKLSIETGLIISKGEHSPFWLTINQHGKYSETKNQAYTGIIIKKHLEQNKVLGLDIVLEPFGRVDTSWHCFLQQGYIEAKFKFLKLYGGLKEETFGIRDTLLSVGSYIWSGNARPMPKITLQTDGFVPVPFFNNWLEFQSLWSHGWFEKERYVHKPFLHHKNLYLRFAEKSRISFCAGIEHFVMWGGTSTSERIGNLPSGWDTYKRIIFAKEISVDSTSVLWTERNAVGNHLGSYNIGVHLKNFFNTSLFLYLQHPFEDKSGLQWKNWEDGLFGISIDAQSKYFTKINLEYINTTNQGVDGVWTEEFGSDSYFNNLIYQDGWSYKKNILGLPLIAPNKYNSDGSRRLRNNALKAYHLGIEGNLNLKTNYIVQALWSKNEGTLYTKYPAIKNQMSISIQIGVRQILNTKLNSKFIIAYDNGQEFGNSIGILMIVNRYITLNTY